MSSILRRLSMLIRRSRYDRELKEEIAFHVEERKRELIADGVPEEEAHFRAQREFGNTLRVQERSRRNVMFWWEWIVQDLQFAVRLIRKAPAFTAVIVISMAIGIGATTSIFSVLNAMVLRELAVRAPGEMYLLSWSLAKPGFEDSMMSYADGSFQREADGRYRSYSISYPLYEMLRRRQTQFEDIFAFGSSHLEINIGIEGRSYPGVYVGVSGNYFHLSGVTAFRGRILDEHDDEKASAPAAMISYRFWMQLGADANIIGKSAVVNGQPVTIVGVAPPGFTGYDPSVKTDVFMPLQHFIQDYDRLQGPFVGSSGAPYQSISQVNEAWWLTTGGRLKPGSNAGTAEAELNSFFQQYVDSIVKSRPAGAEARFEARAAGRGLDTVRAQYETACMLLLGLVGIVLLIACANVSALLLSRAASRQREIAQRLSMGASRGRIIWQLLTESIFLSALGALAGLAIAFWVSSGLTTLIASARNAGAFEIHMDSRVLLFTAAITFVSGIIFGVVPAVQVSRTGPMTALKQVAGTTGTAKGHWPGKMLVAGQLALALLLMVGAVLFTRTLQQFAHMELGFEHQNLMVFNVRPGLNGYAGPKLANYYNELRRRLEAIPGVASVTLAQRNPIGQGWHSINVTLPGTSAVSSGANHATQAPNEREVKDVYLHVVGGDYFSTLRIPMITGRAISESDNALAAKSAVVNQAFVKRYLSNQEPLGMTVRANDTDIAIVGVSGDVKYEHLREDAPPTMYVSYQQRRDMPQWMAFMVRVNGAPGPVMAAIERETTALDSTVPAADLLTEQNVLERALFVERAFTWLSSSFAAIALGLACVGLYGTLSYMVVRRTNEIGVRMALGAQRSNILEMVIRDGWKMALLGVAIGVPLSLAACKLIEAQIYGISARDPLSLAVGVAVVLSIALIVGLLPAWRASRVDPMVALKYE